MISLFLSLVTQTEVNSVLIYIIIALEVLGALANLLVKLTSPKSKFGAFLRKLLPGLKEAIEEIKSIKDDDGDDPL